MRVPPFVKWFLFAPTCAILLYAFDLPPLPKVNVGDFLPPIRAQIEGAEAEALAHPQDAHAAGDLGMVLHAYQQYEAAVTAYSRAHLLEPRNFDWLYLLGVVQMERGEFDAAVGALKAGLLLRPEDLPSQLRLAKSLSLLSQFDEAGTVYREILKRHPDSSQAWYGLGRVDSAKGDHGGAVKCFTEACGLFPSYGTAHFALASELRRQGNSAEADDHLAAYSKHVTDEPPLADPLFEHVHELNHGVSVHIQRGAEFEKAGKLDEAIREHEEALAIDPNDVQVHVNLLSLYGRAGDPVKARRHFDDVMRLNPNRSDAWYDYGVLLFGERKYSDAEPAFRHALEINPHYAEAHNNLGAIYEQQGNLDDAAKEFREAISERPDFSLARFHLGRILVNQDKYEEAIHEFLRILTPEDDNTTLYLYALAAAYARSGDREHAVQYYRTAHRSAVEHSQKQLLGSIERDLKALDAEP